MEPGLIVLLGILGIAVIGAIAYFSWLAEKKRREALFALAVSLGCEYSIEDPLNIPSLLSNIKLFTQGHSREAKNVIRGKVAGRDVLAFDFKYETTETSTDSKGHTTTRDVDHWFSACLHPLECPLPYLMIRPEGFLDKVAGFFGFEDIDFESDEFSRKFQVKSDDRKFAYDVCHPRMMEWLLANRGWHIEFISGYMVLTTGEQTWTPESFRAAIDFTTTFLNQIPQFVWQDRMGRQS
jgi:hypothetical protein